MERESFQLDLARLAPGVEASSAHASALAWAIRAARPHWLRGPGLRDDRASVRVDAWMELLADTLPLPGLLESVREESWPVGLSVRCPSHKLFFVLSGTAVITAPGIAAEVGPGFWGYVPPGLDATPSQTLSVLRADFELYSAAKLVELALERRLGSEEVWVRRDDGSIPGELLQRARAALDQITQDELHTLALAHAFHVPPRPWTGERAFGARQRFVRVAPVAVRGPHAGTVWIVSRRGAVAIDASGEGLARLVAESESFDVVSCFVAWGGSAREAYQDVQAALHELVRRGVLEPAGEAER